VLNGNQPDRRTTKNYEALPDGRADLRPEWLGRIKRERTSPAGTPPNLVGTGHRVSPHFSHYRVRVNGSLMRHRKMRASTAQRNQSSGIQPCKACPNRHCEERGDEAAQLSVGPSRLLRGACHRAGHFRLRAPRFGGLIPAVARRASEGGSGRTRWLAMTRTMSRFCRSIHLDVGVLDHFSPQRKLSLDEVAELFRR
jgi:hypothetical protein